MLQASAYSSQVCRRHSRLALTGSLNWISSFFVYGLATGSWERSDSERTSEFRGTMCACPMGLCRSRQRASGALVKRVSSIRNAVLVTGGALMLKVSVVGDFRR